ncbi:MAG TPA: zinc ribbon domain-containing protein [Anaerolineales bacterium]|nr:zinc ribbon domain-containing protein [Anaerolineales bacterium]
MTRKTVGYVELVWTCPRCSTKNPGPQKFCNGCGGPQPENVAFEQPAQEKFLAEAGAVARAKAGPDIHCPYCGTRNPAGAKFCGNCGGDLAGGKARDRGRVLGAHRAGPAPKVKCPACGTENDADAGRCSNCGSPLPGAARAVPAEERAGAAQKIPPLVLGIGAACLVLGALALYLLFGRTGQVVAAVEAVRWERSIQVEAFGSVEHTDWEDEIPFGAQVGNCRLEYRTTQDQPAAIATEVCGTPYTVDEGSGYGEVAQDCVFEVYDNRCTYVVQEWGVVDTLTAAGSTFDLGWPTANLAADQRWGKEAESFWVVLSADGREYTYQPESEAEFLLFDIDTEWVLEVNSLGGIRSIEPAGG